MEAVVYLLLDFRLKNESLYKLLRRTLRQKKWWHARRTLAVMLILYVDLFRIFIQPEFFFLLLDQFLTLFSSFFIFALKRKATCVDLASLEMDDNSWEETQVAETQVAETQVVEDTELPKKPPWKERLRYLAIEPMALAIRDFLGDGLDRPELRGRAETRIIGSGGDPSYLRAFAQGSPAFRTAGYAHHPRRAVSGCW